jgi:hypothetical protein
MLITIEHMCEHQQRDNQHELSMWVLARAPITLLDLVALLVPLPLASLLQVKALQRDTKQSDERV